VVESDVRYYRRRACEEMGAARRAVTESARERRLQLVDLYLQRLAALNEPTPFDEHDLAWTNRLPPGAKAKGMDPRSAFAWPGDVTTASPRV
jgi:hypothetical protein